MPSVYNDGQLKICKSKECTEIEKETHTCTLVLLKQKCSCIFFRFIEMPIRRHVQNESPRSKSVQSSQNDNRLNPLLFKSGKITKYVITKVNKKTGIFACNACLKFKA